MKNKIKYIIVIIPLLFISINTWPSTKTRMPHPHTHHTRTKGPIKQPKPSGF